MSSERESGKGKEANMQDTTAHIEPSFIPSPFAGLNEQPLDSPSHLSNSFSF